MADFLYLPFKQNDNGARPVTPCGDPNIVWLAYCIWMTNPAGKTLTKAVVGRACFINVGVLSKEPTFIPQTSPVPARVRVQAWACNFTLGVGPAGALPSLGIEGGLDEIDVQLDGRPPSMTDAANHWRVAQIPWTPQASDLINVDAAGEGHICLGANVYWEGNSPPAEGQHLTSGNLAICGNQHHAQRNIGVLPAGSPEQIAMLIQVNNNEIEDELFTLEVAEVIGARKVLGKLERETLLAGPFVDFRAERGQPKVRPIDGEPGDIPRFPREHAILKQKGHLVLADNPRIRLTTARRPLDHVTLEGESGGGPRLKLEIPGEKSQDVELQAEIGPREKPGTVRAFDIVQRRRRRVVGGARVMVVRT